MSLTFQDRVLGTTAEIPLDRATLGRYRVLTEGTVSLNSVRLRSGDYLVPDQEGHWALLAGEGYTTSGLFAPNQLPPQREQESVRQLGGRLETLSALASTWEEWAIVSPIVPVLAKAQMQPLDSAIGRYLWCLQEVCRHPRTHLRTETERLPISRARRIPPQAVEHLATHTEDWQHRKLTSVVPKRILSVMVDDEFDIYENRVAVRLVDHLYRHLCERLEEIRGLQVWFDDVQLALVASSWRNKRVYTLLEQAVLDKSRAAAEKTRQALESLHYQILQLFDSPLYAAILPQLQVPPTLKATNIFANDRHYRYVGLLWRTWQKYGFRPPRTAAQRYRELQQLCRSFNLFCVLLVCRALSQLGFQPRGQAGLARGAKAISLLDGLGQESLLCWSEDDTLTIRQNDRDLIRFVPIVSALALDPDPEKVADTVDTLLAQVPQDRATLDEPLRPFGGCHSVILYSGDTKQRRHLPTHLQMKLQPLGNDLTRPTTAGLLPVSTYSLDSVERVARAIRWVLLGRQILRYPPTIKVPVSYARQIIDWADWLRPTDREDEVRVVQVPDRAGAHALVQRFTEEISRLQKADKTGKYRIGPLTDFERAHRAALLSFEAWLRCPVCLCHDSRVTMEARKDGNFVCRCDSCGSSWGTQACGHCHLRYPFIALGETTSTHRPQYGGWVEDVLGMDVLASPCWLPGSLSNYICPWCGSCRNADSKDGAECLRCAEPSAW